MGGDPHRGPAITRHRFRGLRNDDVGSPITLGTRTADCTLSQARRPWQTLSPSVLSPLIASGTKKTVLARRVHNDRLADAVHQWALGALRGSPGARAYYRAVRARNIGHHAALRQLSNRLVGILHGCLKTRSCYDETKAWAHHIPAVS
jgi:hypothetical protein